MKQDGEIINRVLSRVGRLNDKDVRKSIILYRLIRELYEKNTNIIENDAFMWAYSAYYGLASHYKKDDRLQYFLTLQKYFTYQKTILVDEIVKELKTEKNQYVFATKLMNFIDDDKYPIIDRKVAVVFGFSVTDSFDTRISQIKRIYDNLLNNSFFCDILKKNNFDGVGKMKQVDIIIWNLPSN